MDSKKSITELYDFINSKVEKEYMETKERERIQKEQHEAEEEERTKMLEHLDKFFMPLFEPFTYMIDVSNYQTLNVFPYLYIFRCRDVLDIWGSNLEKEQIQDINANNLIEAWNYDFVKALYDNKESILLDIAVKYGYPNV